MKAARTRALHRKHAGTGKHSSSAKHTPTAHRRGAAGHAQVSRRVHLTAKAAKARAWTPDGDVALCSARAVAESLRLAGGSVADADVLALFWLAGGDADAGVSILAALEAASASGFGGCSQILAEQLRERDGVWMHPMAGLDFDQALAFVERRPVSVQRERNPAREFSDGQFRLGHALILGLALPWGEPHAVAAGPDGAWWSWGEPWCPCEFPGAVIEEAWAVTW